MPLNDVELDIVTFFEALVAVELDCGVVHEDIGTVVPPDESIAFSVVEPLHFSFVSCHGP